MIICNWFKEETVVRSNLARYVFVLMISSDRVSFILLYADFCLCELIDRPRVVVRIFLRFPLNFSKTNYSNTLLLFVCFEYLFIYLF